MMTMEKAQEIIGAGIVKAKEIGQPMNIAVVDAGANLTAFARMDGAWLGSIDIAINKAFTAKAFDISTLELGRNSQPGDQFFGNHVSNHTRVMIFAGGIPIKINGLRNLIIGVQMVGSDAMNTRPAHALARRGIVQNVRGYMLYGDYRQPHPPSAIIDAVEDGDVDVAVVWGPMAGYFAALGSKPLTVDPVEPMGDGTDLPMAFYVSMGVRRGDNALLQRLDDSLERNRAAVSAILADYHVPLLPDAFATH